MAVAVAALCFMEIWKRQQAELQYDWDVADFEIEEVIRSDAVQFVTVLTVFQNASFIESLSKKASI